MITITHNFDPAKFVWLWSKYVIAFNPKHHCTNSIRGWYSRRLWKGNPHLREEQTIPLDEHPDGSYRAIYICGVSTVGYRSHANYPHNVHAAVLPAADQQDSWQFENWRLTVEGGRFLPIPASPDELPPRFRSLPDEYVSCRIFRWAACHFAESPPERSLGGAFVEQ